MSRAITCATVVLSALSVTSAPQADDDPRTAAGLVEACGRFLAENDSDSRWAWCAGTLHGVQALLQSVSSASAPACPPQDATVERLADVVVGFAKGHPERLNEPGVGFALQALAASFPCPGPGDLDRLTPAARQLLVRGVQQRLAELGYEAQPNGFYGPQTSAAIREYRRDRGLVGGDEIDEALLQHLTLRSTPAPKLPAKPASARKPPRASARD